MLTKEEIEKRFNIVKETHDEIKEHPYWLNFDNSLLSDVLRLFNRISTNVHGITDNTNPYYAIIKCVTHDFNCMVHDILDSLKTKRFQKEWEDHMGDVIMVLQVYLQNIHRIIDGYIPEDENVIGYNYKKFDKIECGIAKFQAFKKEGGKDYIVYRILSKNSIPNIKRSCEKYLGLSDRPIKTWAINCLKEIEEGKDIIGGCFKIV